MGTSGVNNLGGGAWERAHQRRQTDVWCQTRASRATIVSAA
jgi:hypothetical protein